MNPNKKGGYCVLQSPIDKLDSKGFGLRLKGLEIRDCFSVLLLPRNNFIFMARRPSNLSVALNVVENGLGVLHIDRSRVTMSSADPNIRVNAKHHDIGGKRKCQTYSGGYGNDRTQDMGYHSVKGRFPSNIVLMHGSDCNKNSCGDTCAMSELDLQGIAMGMHSAGYARTYDHDESYQASSYDMSGKREINRYGDEGGASRFFKQFYNPKELDNYLKGLTGNVNE